MEVRLTGKEAVGLYLLLRGAEVTLDHTLSRLRKRIEAALYETLTVDEIEHLEDFYRSLAEGWGMPGS